MKIRYVELPPTRIFNRLDPVNSTAGALLKDNEQLLGKRWWDEDVVEMRKYFARVWTEEFDRITEHFSKLRESIKQHGILAPISTISGPPRDKQLRNPSTKNIEKFAPEFKDEPDKLLYTQPFGGSRLTIARDLNLDKIPCIVYDFSNLFPNAPRVTRDNYKTWFGSGYAFCGGLPNIRLSKHSHIVDGEYQRMDNKTKDAQQAAREFARQQTYAKFNIPFKA